MIALIFSLSNFEIFFAKGKLPLKVAKNGRNAEKASLLRGRRRRKKYDPSCQHPLAQKEQDQPRNAQHADQKGVEEVQPQSDAGEGGGGAHQGQCPKPQDGVPQKAQEKPQGSSEQVDQRDEEKDPQGRYQDPVAQVQRASSFPAPTRSLMERSR